MVEIKHPAKTTRDGVIWAKLENDVDKWVQKACEKDSLRAAGNFIHESVGKECKDCKPEETASAIKGGFNIIYRLMYEDGSSLALKIPLPGMSKNPEDRIVKEAGTMIYVAQNFDIPVPKVRHHGNADENPTNMGPFIIMDWIDHENNMSCAMKDPNLPLNSRPVLDPNISEEKLEFMYGQMARILLQLSSREFYGVGSLRVARGPDEKSEFETGQRFLHGRAVAMCMNEVLVHTNAPVEHVLPDAVVVYTDAWYERLANVLMAQLAHQLNDAVIDEHDAREKYVARQLFRKLAVEGRLTQGLPPKHHGQSTLEERFRLLAENLRPANVLLDKYMRVVRVVDWGFNYTAPWQFTFDPPWWLLLREPEDCSGGFPPSVDRSICSATADLPTCHGG